MAGEDINTQFLSFFKHQGRRPPLYKKMESFVIDKM